MRLSTSALTGGLILIFTFALAMPLGAQPIVTTPGTLVAFNPQPDPPGFGIVPVRAGESIWLNVVCFDHPVGGVPPDPCRGTFMFHDAAGDLIKSAHYDLKPGEATLLAWRAPIADTTDSVRTFFIDPCWLPDPGGRAIPDVEVLDGSTGKVTRHENPAAARMSYFNDGLTNPGVIVGFNPQPDPPGFGMITLVGQGARMAVSCFEHPVNGVPPGPCSGEVMFHDAQGNVLKSGRYGLKPGESFFLDFVPSESVGIDAVPAVQAEPCILPAPGGRAVPNVIVFDLATGGIDRLVGPVVARMTQFQM